MNCYGSKILDDLKIQQSKSMKLYYDNKSAIRIAQNSLQHDQKKHIEIDRHFIKEKLDSGLICTSCSDRTSTGRCIDTKIV